MLFNRYTSARLRRDTDDGEGNQGGGGSQPREPETFSKDYVRELRAENKGWRLKASEHEAAAKAAAEAAKKAAEDAQAAIAESNTKAEQRIIRAELKALAVKAGIVDLDGLKLVELGDVKLDDKGEVVGADALIEGLKKAKPYLFAAPASSSSAKEPDKDPPAAKKATEMTKEEYAAERARLIGKR
ncbi:MAG: hypothetical protein KGL35_08410 [Bradyrhizobium sp.]|nr:hypothetical protein [Bradyrhizobium sp.]